MNARLLRWLGVPTITDELLDAIERHMEELTGRHTMNYRLFVSDDRTVLVRLWEDGEVEASLRPADAPIWGPPIQMHEEKV